MAEFSRHEERIIALQLLYALDIREELEPGRAAEQIIKTKKRKDLNEDKNYYFEVLVKGAVENRGRLDEFIDKQAQDWTLERTACIDRNILRIALFEIEGGKVPPIVAVDEAVELAKEYGSDKSPSFINGLLSQHKIVSKKGSGQEG
ncbi:MAG: transcription antitermination factor NusB [Bacillota bacterium]